MTLIRMDVDFGQTKRGYIMQILPFCVRSHCICTIYLYIYKIHIKCFAVFLKHQLQLGRLAGLVWLAPICRCFHPRIGGWVISNLISQQYPCEDFKGDEPNLYVAVIRGIFLERPCFKPNGGRGSRYLALLILAECTDFRLFQKGCESPRQKHNNGNRFRFFLDDLTHSQCVFQ